MDAAQLLSLSEDDFEVIQSGVDSTYRSIDPTLNDSLVLPPMLVSTTTLTDEHTIKNDESHATIPNEQETALLNCSIVSGSSSHSSDAISNILRSQSETMSLMEKQLAEFSIIQESIRTSNTLQSRVEELVMDKEKLEKELEETRSQLISLRTISDSIQSDVRQEVNDELRKKDAIISSLSLQVVSLEQSRQASIESQPKAHEVVLQRAPSFDEVERLRQENASLHKKNAELNTQLSEEYAKRLGEKELRKTLQSSLESMSMTGQITLEDQQTTRAIQELMAKSDECEQQKVKIRDLENELNATKSESANNGEIITVLQEENVEGTRMLAENRRRIDNMKRTLEKYGHFSDF